MVNDDDVTLSESTLKALEEFYKEQEQLKSRVISEDWVFLPKICIKILTSNVYSSHKYIHISN
jgi:hypothetical protein